MDYQFVHAIEGRIRIRIPLLAEDTGYANKLQSLVESLSFVTNVRINPLAESIIVTYKFKAVSIQAMQVHLQQAIEQAAPSQPPSSPPPAPEPAVVKEKPPEVSKEVVQEKGAYTAEQVNLDEDIWEDGTTTATPPLATEAQQDLPAQSVSSADNDKADNEVSQPPEDGVQKEVHPVTLQTRVDDTPLKISALAKRLGVTPQTLTRHRSKPNFGEWSKTKDPDGIAWIYEPASKTFCPIKPPLSESEQSDFQEQAMWVEVEEVSGCVADEILVGEVVGEIADEVVGGVPAEQMEMVVGQEIGSAVTEVVEEEVAVSAEFTEPQEKKEVVEEEVTVNAESTEPQEKIDLQNKEDDQANQGVGVEEAANPTLTQEDGISAIPSNSQQPTLT